MGRALTKKHEAEIRRCLAAGRFPLRSGGLRAVAALLTELDRLRTVLAAQLEAAAPMVAHDDACTITDEQIAVLKRAMRRPLAAAREYERRLRAKERAKVLREAADVLCKAESRIDADEQLLAMAAEAERTIR